MPISDHRPPALIPPQAGCHSACGRTRDAALARPRLRGLSALAGWLRRFGRSDAGKIWGEWARFRCANGCIFDARGTPESLPGGRVLDARPGAFSIDENTDDSQTGLAGHIAEYLGELDVHLDESLLHPQNVRGTVLNQLGAVPQEGAQGYQVRFGPEGIGQQAIRMERLDPLTIQHIALASRETADGGRIDKTALKAAAFQHLCQHPIFSTN